MKRTHPPPRNLTSPPSPSTSSTSTLHQIHKDTPHSTASFNKSSSHSDAEAPSSEYPGHSGSNEEPKEFTEEKCLSKNGELLKGKKSKKKGRKSTKSSNKDHPQPSVHSARRSQASKKRRAYILQRIRSDSFNTSSDEEHSLNSTSSDSLIATAKSSTSQLAGSVWTNSFKEEKNLRRNTEEIKEELKKRILSKKPPAYFETPGTDPIFHEVGLYMY